MQLLIFFLGVIAAIVGYIFSNFFLKPLNNYYDIRAKIGYKLTYYAHIITSPGSSKQLATEAYSVIRDLACDLERRYLSIPFCRFVSAVRIVPVEDRITDAKGQLIFISNSLNDTGQTDQNHIALGKVFELLEIKELKNGMMVKSGDIYGKHET